MIRRLRQNIFVPRYDYPNRLDQQRAQSLLAIISIATFVMGLYALVLLFYVTFLGSTVTPLIASTIVMPLLLGIIYILVSRGNLRAGVVVLIALGILSSYLVALNNFNTVTILTLIFPVIAASVLLDWRGTFVTVAIMVGLLMQITFFSAQANTENITQDFAILSVLIMISGAWITIFSSNIQSSVRRSLANIDDLKHILARIAQTGINTDEENLSADVIDILREHLGYTFARIFLTNDDTQINRSIAVGLNKAQINVETRIRIGSDSAIYEAIRSGEAVLLHSDSSERRRGHLLPGIASAAIIPIRAEGELIGILDVQHEEDVTFSSEEVDLLVLLADHLGGTIVQSRIINELRGNLSEQNEIVARQRDKLLEYERAEERATISTWTAYLEQRGFNYLGYDIDSPFEEPKFSTSLAPNLHSALQTGDITVMEEEDFQLVSVPITLRGRTLGAMSFKVSAGSQKIGIRQQELIRSVVQRLGLALENKRLLEQSRAQAQRESKANEVGSLLLSSTDIETVLNLAAQNFNEALGAVQTQIHLQPEIRRTSEGSA